MGQKLYRSFRHWAVPRYIKYSLHLPGEARKHKVFLVHTVGEPKTFGSWGRLSGGSDLESGTGRKTRGEDSGSSVMTGESMLHAEGRAHAGFPEASQSHL